MKNQVEVRPARADDKDAVLAFCQNTFSWGDYVPDVWDHWLMDPNSRMFVGLVAGKPVGMVHIAFLENNVVWMEGMRVHPDFRRRGIATAMDAAGHDYARERGCHIARLATSIKNIAAQKTLATQGYHCVTRFNEWTAKSARKKFPDARVATRRDAPGILARWEQSEIRAASRALLPARHWRETDLTEACVLERIAADEVRVMLRGFAILPAFDEKNWNTLAVHALIGDAEAIYALAVAARGEAYYRGYPHVEAMVADHATLNTALESAGYRREGGMLIYEQTL